MPRRLLIVAFALVFLHACVIVMLGPSSSGSFVANSIEILICGLAVAMCIRASRRAHGLSRPFWLLVATGIAMWAVANLGWMYYEVGLGIEPPTGSLVRFLFASQAVFFAMALLLDQGRDSSRLDLESLLDFTQLTIVFFLIYLSLYYLPSLRADQHTAMIREIWVEIGEDLALLLLAVVQYARKRASPIRSLYAGLAIYLAAYTIGAGISDYQQTIREAPTGTWFDFSWTLPLLFAAFWAATWKPSQQPAQITLPRQRTIGEMLLTNTMFAIAPLVVLLQIAQLGTGWRFLRFSLLGISILCFAARLALSESHEAKSAESVRLHALAMDSAVDGMAILDDTGKYIYVNSAFAQMMGYDNLQFMLGKPWHELVNPRDAEGVVPEIRESLKKLGRWFGPMTLHHPAGTALPVEMAITALPDGGTVCVGRNISDRRKAEAARIEAEFKYRTFVEQVAAISYVAELGVDGQWLYVSPQVETILGYAPDEWLAKSQDWLKLVSPEDHATVEIAEEAFNVGVGRT